MIAVIAKRCSLRISSSYIFSCSNATISALDIEKKSSNRDFNLYNVKSAVADVKSGARAKFVESVEMSIMLGVDPRKPNQSVRGVVQLPHGTGKSVRVAVFANPDKEEEALAAGASIVGGADLIKKIQDGHLDFDKCVATPDMMPLVGRIARILGPRGLMPNPKLGTVTQDVATAVKAAKAGQLEFRAGKNGIVQVAVGKVSFSEDELLDNIKSFMVALSNAKPEGAKGKYIKKASMCSTMGKGKFLDLVYLDPSSNKFMHFDE